MTHVDDLNAVELPAKEKRVVEGLLDEIYPSLSKAWGARCCLPASRALVEGLRAVGITANPCPVQVVAYPPNYTRRMREEGRPATDDDEANEWQDGQMAHGILFDAHDVYEKAGYPDLDSSWVGGHCVVVMLTGGQHYLLDPSLPQMHHPEHGIELEPTILPVTREFAAGDEEAQGLTEGDVLLSYHAHPEHQSYLETEGYMAPEQDAFSPISALVFHFKRRAKEIANGS